MPSDDEDIFIPTRGAPHGSATRGPVERSNGRGHGRNAAPRVPASAVEDDDVFVARSGPPVEVQSDFVRDLEATDPDAVYAGGVSDDEYFSGLEPRATTAAGWTTALLTEHGLELRHGRVRCRYAETTANGWRSCPGITSNVPGISAHAYDCVYWDREGKDKTPF